MPHGFMIEGLAAIEIIMQHATGLIAAQWDGSNARVAFIRAQDGRVSVQFVARDEAVRQLFAIADQSAALDRQVRIRAQASTLAEGERAGILDGVLVGEEDLQFVDIMADDIRGGPPLDLAGNIASLESFIDRCSTHEGAVSLFEEVVASTPSGASLEVLGLLELVRDRWDDKAAIVAAIQPAIRSIEPCLGRREGQRARMALLGLGQAASDRAAGSVVNARGGAA